MRWDMGRLQRLVRLKIWWAGEPGRQCPMRSQVGTSISERSLAAQFVTA